MNTKLMVIWCTALLSVVGCVGHSGPNQGYLKPGENVYGKASRLSASEKSRLINDSVQRLVTDPMFTELYAIAVKKAKERGCVRPILVVTPIENNTGDGRSDSVATGQMYKELITAFRKTGKFTLRDRISGKKVIDDIEDGNNNGENADALSMFGSYASPDFVMTGQLRREIDEEDRGRTVYTHNLNLEMTDTRTMDIFWSDTIPFPAKFEW